MKTTFSRALPPSATVFDVDSYRAFPLFFRRIIDQGVAQLIPSPDPQGYSSPQCYALSAL